MSIRTCLFAFVCILIKISEKIALEIPALCHLCTRTQDIIFSRLIFVSLEQFYAHRKTKWKIQSSNMPSSPSPIRSLPSGVAYALWLIQPCQHIVAIQSPSLLLALTFETAHSLKSVSEMNPSLWSHSGLPACRPLCILPVHSCSSSSLQPQAITDFLSVFTALLFHEVAQLESYMIQTSQFGFFSVNNVLSGFSVHFKACSSFLLSADYYPLVGMCHSLSIHLL